MLVTLHDMFRNTYVNTVQTCPGCNQCSHYLSALEQGRNHQRGIAVNLPNSQGHVSARARACVCMCGFKVNQDNMQREAVKRIWANIATQTAYEHSVQI